MTRDKENFDIVPAETFCSLEGTELNGGKQIYASSHNLCDLYS